MKDPAFLFYPEAFEVGTRKMTDAEVGQYIRALNEQFFEGRIDEQFFDNLSPRVQEKFVRIKGGYINKRLRFEIEKRKKYTESRRANGSRGGRPKKQEETKEKPKENHMDSEIGNHMRNININKNKNTNNIKEDHKKETIKAVVDHLNEVAGTKYKATSQVTRRHISARLEEGFTQEQMFEVIDKQAEQWLGTEWAKYLRPETLFNASKFESYLNAPRSIQAQEQEQKNQQRAQVITSARREQERLQAELTEARERCIRDPNDAEAIRARRKVEDELDRVVNIIARATS